MNSIKLFSRLIVIITLTLFLSAFVSAQTDSEGLKEKKRAERTWEAVIKVKGGREKLHSIHSMVVSSRSKVQDSFFKTYDHIVESLYVFPDRQWRWDDNRPGVFGLQTSMYNYGAGMKYHKVLDSPDNNDLLVPFEANESNKKGSQLTGLVNFLLETKWWQPSPQSVIHNPREFKNAYIIRTVFAGQQLDYVIDRRTHLPIQVIGYYLDPITKKERQGSYRFSDYIDIDGIKMPSKFSFGEESGVENLRFEFNVEYDENIFKMPPPFEAGPQAWKKKK